jgi:hypothetical protein
MDARGVVRGDQAHEFVQLFLGQGGESISNGFRYCSARRGVVTGSGGVRLRS